MVHPDRGEELDVKKVAVLQLLEKQLELLVNQIKTAEEAVHDLEESSTYVNAEEAPRNVAVVD